MKNEIQTEYDELRAREASLMAEAEKLETVKDGLRLVYTPAASKRYDEINEELDRIEPRIIQLMNDPARKAR